ncbi:hypothetical protein MRX96_050942 [Rhipicephalus microplus]
MSGRKRFTLGDDVALVKEVFYLNPFLDHARWLKIADRLSEVLGSSGTEEEQSELGDLLQQAAGIAHECGYTPQPSTVRQLAERDDIKKRAKVNLVAHPPAKRRVNNKEEDALAAYAEFTAGDGVEHGPQRHAEATYALIEARCDRDTAIENCHLQLEEDRLRFEAKRLEREMKLKEMELQQRQAEQEAKFELKELELQQRRQELEALAEERRHNRGY